jgi:Fe-S cluster assembly iron-binding protein IscA
MDIVKTAIDNDITLEQNGLKVFLETKASGVLAEATIDFSDEQGFFISGVVANSCSEGSCSSSSCSPGSCCGS